MYRNSSRLSAGGDPNLGSGLRVAFVVAVAFFLASFAPQPLIAATLAGLLRMAALIMASLAAVTREPLWGDDLTRWDEALFLLAASLVAGMFVDPAAVAELLADVASQAPAS